MTMFKQIGWNHKQEVKYTKFMELLKNTGIGFEINNNYTIYNPSKKYFIHEAEELPSSEIEVFFPKYAKGLIFKARSEKYELYISEFEGAVHIYKDGKFYKEDGTFVKFSNPITATRYVELLKEEFENVCVFAGQDLYYK